MTAPTGGAPAPRLTRPLFVSGFMATGKSTVGAIVAKRLGVPFADTDALLEAETGKTVAELFAGEGEARFREREATLVASLLLDRTPRVISLGGGTVTMAHVRHALLEAGTVVSLTAKPETIVARVKVLAGRPNLATASPLDRARDLLTLRREAYAECHAAIATEDRDPERIADLVIDAATSFSLAMPLGLQTYAVELGIGIGHRLGPALAAMRPSSLVVVTDENVLRERGAWLDAALAGSNVARHDIVFPAGEASKTLATVARIWDEALTAGIDRDAVVLAFGGGVVGDLGGFAASTVLRGVRCVQIATSLLAMVDSSVGGKTGFDVAQGKNLVGAFFQPSRVIVDIEHLVTLPARERAAGLAEVVKIALVRNEALLREVEESAGLLRDGDSQATLAVVRAAIEEKIRVVREDEREAGVRALLNLGHTVGHALEAHGGYATLLHGEAVAVGTVHELEACERLGHTPAGTAQRAARIFEALGLPTRATREDLAASWPFVASDKKRTASAVKLPVVARVGAGAVIKVELDILRDALNA